MAAKVGYCGLDRRRAPLAGDEIRACWEAGGLAADHGAVPPLPLFGPPVAHDGRRDFVEVGAAPADPAADPAGDGAPVEPMFDVPPAASAEPRWSLWADLEA